MNDQWYYAKNGVQAGPLSESELKQMASSGQLAPVDMVWKTGMANWVQARSVQDLNLPSCPAPLPASSSAPDYPGIFFGYLKKYKVWIGFVVLFLALCYVGWRQFRKIEVDDSRWVNKLVSGNEKVLGKWRSGKTTVEFTQSEMIMGENGINLSMGTYKFTKSNEIELTLSELAKNLYRKGHETKESFRKADAAIQQEKYIPHPYKEITSVVIKVKRAGEDLLFRMNGEPDMMMNRVD